jgi:hypothetical protein
MEHLMKYLVLPGLSSTANPAKGLGPNMTRVKAWVEDQGGEYLFLPELEEAKTNEEMADLLDRAMIGLWPTCGKEGFKIITSSFGAWLFLMTLLRRQKLPAGYKGAILIEPFISVADLRAKYGAILSAIFSLTGYWRGGKNGNPMVYVWPSMVRSMLRNDMLPKLLPLYRKFGKEMQLEVMCTNTYANQHAAAILEKAGGVQYDPYLGGAVFWSANRPPKQPPAMA